VKRLQEQKTRMVFFELLEERMFRSSLVAGLFIRHFHSCLGYYNGSPAGEVFVFTSLERIIPAFTWRGSVEYASYKCS
jgi:hypothetical protein